MNDFETLKAHINASPAGGPYRNADGTWKTDLEIAGAMNTAQAGALVQGAVPFKDAFWYLVSIGRWDAVDATAKPLTAAALRGAKALLSGGLDVLTAPVAQALVAELTSGATPELTAAQGAALLALGQVPGAPARSDAQQLYGDHVSPVTVADVAKARVS